MPAADSPSRRGLDGRSQANALDIYVGHRLAFRRAIIEMDRAELANRIGLSIATIESMEAGAQRIGVSDLYRLAEILEVPVAWFYEGLPQGPSPAASTFVRDTETSLTGASEDELSLIQSYRKLLPEERSRLLRYSRRLRRRSGGT
ncbi:MAG TPA: helix-turn-helix transcriptional regulator [Hyphomicrobiaceae bacterium]|nr:helix-turn-helix transcriptional regulator [Hyphomicrobiaceae bacterium]